MTNKEQLRVALSWLDNFILRACDLAQTDLSETAQQHVETIKQAAQAHLDSVEALGRIRKNKLSGHKIMHCFPCSDYNCPCDALFNNDLDTIEQALATLSGPVDVEAFKIFNNGYCGQTTMIGECAAKYVFKNGDARRLEKFFYAPRLSVGEIVDGGKLNDAKHEIMDARDALNSAIEKIIDVECAITAATKEDSDE